MRNNTSMILGCVIVATASLVAVSPVRPGDPARRFLETGHGESTHADKRTLLTVAEARGRARLLHTTYVSTLSAVHRAYFEEGHRQRVPARVLEGVFFWVDRETQGKTRWIAVNTPAMSIDHKPENDLERRAAQALASGEDQFEIVADGFYHRASAVPLSASCLKCHEPSFVQRKRPQRRVAGLVISLPVKLD